MRSLQHCSSHAHADSLSRPQNNAESLTQLFRLLKLICEVFYSLTWQDIPAYVQVCTFVYLCSVVFLCRS